MSFVTTRLIDILASYAELDFIPDFDSPEYSQMLHTGRIKLFSFAYPMFTAEQKERLEKNIIQHYLTREIGSETVGLFRQRLQAKLCEIMPEFIQLYKLAEMDYNPLNTVDILEEFDRTTENTSENNSTSTAESTVKTDEWVAYSDTPQGGLSGVKNLAYLTSATNNTADNTSETTGEISGTSEGSTVDSYTKHTHGYSGGDVSERVRKYRENVLNVDNMIIDKLNELFMTIYF
ncbi:MAG: hypothetical protein MJ237_08370 [bacterium]|nr:hypothetical protein [bacterium]